MSHNADIICHPRDTKQTFKSDYAIHAITFRILRACLKKGLVLAAPDKRVEARRGEGAY